MSLWLLLLLCVALPPVWSLCVRRALEFLEKRRARFRPDGKPPSDYSI